jgi:hypothetical protein
VKASGPRIEKPEGKVVVAGMWSDTDDAPFRLLARVGNDLPAKETKQALSYFLSQLYRDTMG